MYASLILVYLVVALTFSSCTVHKKRCSNSQIFAIMLRSSHCDEVEQFDLCSCCHVDPCDAVECLNGGECIGDGVCQCVSGYSGPTCNIDPCDGVECFNGGQCVGDGVCNCTFGFGGANCNITLDPCDGVECLNGGQCVGEGVCNCTFGFGGANCNRRVCNVTECTDRDGRCIVLRCINNATNCGGKVCNTTNNEVCIDDTCVDKGDVCDGTICVDTGEPCGEGFCGSIPNLCVNETCRFILQCNTGDTMCSSITGITGSCSDGVCLVGCSEDRDCTGLPCIGGFCASIKCGESFCEVISG